MIYIARAGKGADHDDVIIAERVDSNVHIEHTDGSRKSKIVTNTILTHTGLAGYVSTLAAMIRDDTEPFASIQFNFPGFPMVVYTPARLHNPDVMHTIKNAARITSDSWFRDDPTYDADDDFSDSSSSSSDDSGSTTSSDGTYIIHEYRYCCPNNDDC